MVGFTRRTLMTTTAGVALAGFTGSAFSAERVGPRARAVPVPTRHVTLQPSIFADAQTANATYLRTLSPDRLLHNFHKAAGLAPKGELYGGWEAQSIAGHTLGHYLSACSLLIANTDDPLLRDRLTYTVTQLARIQAAHGDGYVGGAVLWGGTDPVEGKQVFERLRRGDITANPFTLNDAWVPLYAWHKVHAGLLAAHSEAGIHGALAVAEGLADYLGTILEALDDNQIQSILVAEHGGLNEVYAETFALTGNTRWLALARRLCHRAVLDPLADGRDELAGLHANTQIPKVIGLARLYEVAGDPADASTARFFHETVSQRHSYVIGGNSDREHFSAPLEIAGRISETTCEACNTYNMLKLTRSLYAWAPNASLFDGYERAQLNHIMAHQRPDTGQFVYFMPLATGARRSYSTPEDSFWCCVGSGMESHAKHADSIYWRDERTLYVNLFIASTLSVPDEGLELHMDTAFPADGRVRIVVSKAPSTQLDFAIRLPVWCADPRLVLNGSVQALHTDRGYARLSRRWNVGDEIMLNLPMTLWKEPTPGDPFLQAFLSGPLVLAADAGPADMPFQQGGQALVSDQDPCGLLTQAPDAVHVYTAQSALGETMTFKPFFDQYDRRTAVYIPVFSHARWSAGKEAFLAAERLRIDLVRRTVDTVYFGEQQPEVDHGVSGIHAEIIQWNGRSGRRILDGGHVDFTLKRSAVPQVLRLVFWGQDAGQTGRLFVEGEPGQSITWPGPARDGFQHIDLLLEAGPAPARVRLMASGAALVIYEALIVESGSA